ncbi:hypothetical protein CF70_015100 [Cupriavidus sp. SK-3]|uniref:hypothetical protein n=1 Tax=Cupriavidus sp. SK-3 TaxID=1470558 RepID=UPI000452F88E|nr:hypothetical protein [Cupriavidus sp. SK-3]KDP85185.1 hypothetical protein CF70_015100 [Cupriavidus sp. SK-3]
MFPEFDLPWVEPAVHLCAEWARHGLRDALLPALPAAIWDVWRDETAPEAKRLIYRQVLKGLCEGLGFLLNVADQPIAVKYHLLFDLPGSWAPPIADVDTILPLFQRQAYQWAADVVAYIVGLRLKPIHVFYGTQDATTLRLESLIRNAIYSEMLRQPAAAWRLTGYFRAAVFALMTDPVVDLPQAVEHATALPTEGQLEVALRTRVRLPHMKVQTNKQSSDAQAGDRRETGTPKLPELLSELNRTAMSGSSSFTVIHPLRASCRPSSHPAPVSVSPTLVVRL